MDYTVEDFTKYKQYLNTLTITLNKYFEDQKEYICCKQGCSHCCEKGEYPFSQLEFNYMLLGFFKLPVEERNQILIRIRKLKEEYNALENKENFSHRCPFLSEDKTCSIYDYRGIICRVFGLITKHESGKYSIPFCYSLGLNYSKIYNSETKKFDYDLVKKYGYKKLPEAHRTNLKCLMAPEMFEGEPLNFGEMKPLINWL